MADRRALRVSTGGQCGRRARPVRVGGSRRCRCVLGPRVKKWPPSSARRSRATASIATTTSSANGGFVARVARLRRRRRPRPRSGSTSCASSGRHDAAARWRPEADGRGDRGGAVLAHERARSRGRRVAGPGPHRAVPSLEPQRISQRRSRSPRRRRRRVRLLPGDDASYGFDNIGGVLKLSPTLLERYLSAADKISRLAVGTASPFVNGRLVSHSGRSFAGTPVAGNTVRHARRHPDRLHVPARMPSTRFRRRSRAT